MVSKLVITPLINGVYWGYNPLILTIDPNLPRDIQEPVEGEHLPRSEKTELVTGECRDGQCRIPYWFASWRVLKPWKNTHETAEFESETKWMDGIHETKEMPFPMPMLSMLFDGWFACRFFFLQHVSEQSGILCTQASWNSQKWNEFL